eukprot:9482385-Pyramimonas_sp.AAC.1
MVRTPDLNDAGGKRWVKVPGSALADPWRPTSKGDTLSVANWMIKDCRRVATGKGTACTEGAPTLVDAGVGNGTGEGVVFSVGEETTIKQWHHLAGDSTSGDFSDDHRLVRVSTAEIGRHMMDSLDDAVRALEPHGDLFDYQIAAAGMAFVPWLSKTAAFEWRASVR